MNRQELHQSLEALHAELSRAAPLDGDLREQLEQLAGDISRHLADGGEQQAASQLSGGLHGLVESFEATHPRLTDAVNRLADALAGLGI